MSSHITDKAAHSANSITSSCINHNNNNNKTNPKPPNETTQKSADTCLPPIKSPSSNGSTKSHKIEGKNKKSLHHKQQQNQISMGQQRASPQNSAQQQTSQSSQQSATSNRRSHHQKNGCANGPGANKLMVGATSSSTLEPTNVCLTLDDFSKRAQNLKADINKALEMQTSHQNTDQPIEVVKLKEDILKLSGLEANKNDDLDGVEQESTSTTVSVGEDETDKSLANGNLKPKEGPLSHTDHDQIDAIKDNQQAVDIINATTVTTTQSSTSSGDSSQTLVNDGVKSSQGEENHNNNSNNLSLGKKEKPNDGPTECETKIDLKGYKSDSNLNEALSKLKIVDDQAATKESPTKTVNKSASKKQRVTSNLDADCATTTTTYSNNNSNRSNDHIISDEFEPLDAKLDSDSKFVALKSSLQKHFNEAPHLLEPVCRKLVNMSEQNGQLIKNCEKYQSENQKLNLVKQKLENLCRELQKSNNAIRIESLDLIKVEQGKAKEQTTKIQSTLSGVIKLFDENQQRNMSLRQENQELQTKLKSLLDHCDNWEKSVEAALRQRDIENRLIKTELAKANLLKNEEKEKFLGEKQELLQILSMMQEQQHRIEGQEAKLRSDLSSYASKYDECQAVISKGMNKFQTESKKMLKQIERSKQDYKLLLSKYESSNKRMAQLLEEKQYWDRAMSLANKKIETLEKLCRALRERKQEGKNELPATGAVPTSKQSKANKSNNAPKVSTGQAEPKRGIETDGAMDSNPTNTNDQDLSSLEDSITGADESALVSKQDANDCAQILPQNGLDHSCKEQIQIEKLTIDDKLDVLSTNGCCRDGTINENADLGEARKPVDGTGTIGQANVAQMDGCDTQLNTMKP